MEIEYLQNYRDNIDILNRNKNRSPVEPATMEEIQALEAELNNGTPFPKTIREFLYLGGNLSRLPGTLGIYHIKRFTKLAKEHLKKAGHPFTRPILVFHQLDSEQFVFVYLDEGDNPKTWICAEDKEILDADHVINELRQKDFKEFIDLVVSLAVKGLGL